MKKNLFFLSLLFMASISVYSQSKLYLTANGVTKTATLVQNEATAELLSILEKGPIIMTMTENGGFEKIGNLPKTLSTSDERQTAQSGDIMLYVGNVMCIFYGSNTWSYTKLGTLDNMTSAEIKEFLLGNPLELILSIENEAGIKEIISSEINSERIFDLKGREVTQRPLKEGFYIIDGKKTLIK